jgi:hypothetical protein
MLWIDTKTNEEARWRGEAQWTPVWTENEDGSATAGVPGPEKVEGRFWGDAIKEVQDDPAARLAMAERYLPLPGAFSEMAVARRAIIRQLKKEGKPFDQELHQLHYWAALSSWSVPYSEVLGEPGFNVLESTPYAKLAGLVLAYDVIGCDELLGLNKTDRKMMREAWGEPKAHTTAHALYSELWRKQESELAAVRSKRRADLMDEIVALTRSTPSVLSAPAAPERLGLLSRILGGIRAALYLRSN